MRTLCVSLWALGVCLLAVTAIAAESPAYEHLKDLECFIGEWESQSVIPESSAYSVSAKEWQGKPLLLRANIAWTAGKGALKFETVFDVPGEVRISATTLWGWDQTINKIKGTRFTSHKGVWSETVEKHGEKWISTYTGTNLDGAQCAGTATYTFPGNETMVMSETGQTVDGKPLPDVTYEFKRVSVPPQASHYEKLKELEFFVGQWEAKVEGGATFQWVFNWTEDKNFLQNVITGKDAKGNAFMSNKGYLGWDPNYRQITCWCVDIEGNRPVFLWQKQADGTWDTWAPGGGYKGKFTMMEDGTWRHDSEGEQLHFKRLAK